MEFIKLTEPTLFLSSPADLGEMRAKLSTTVERFARGRLKPYAWEDEFSDSGFDQWRAIAEQIPLPIPPFCKVVVCLLGERLGTPLVNARSLIDKLGPEELWRPPGAEYRLELDWKEGLEEERAFPLTGTVFEVLAALASNHAHPTNPETKQGTPSLLIWLVGDESVLQALESDITFNSGHANWGNRALHKLGKDRVEFGGLAEWERKYFSQLRQLRNFANYLLKCRGVPIDKTSIVRSREEAVTKCKEFLLRQGYRDTSLNAFKGLSYYDFADRDVFYGRGQWLDDAIAVFRRLWSPRSAPFYGILGGSGVGKSSLLRAGMLPLLRDRGYCVAICESNDFKPRNREEVSDELRGSSFERIVKKALYSIYEKQAFDESKEDNILTVAEQHKLEITRKLEHLNDIVPARQIHWAIEEIKSSLNSVLGTQTNLVIGLDQFEELLDFRTAADTVNNRQLERLFEFIVAACGSGRIGFVYTCQNNRREKLAGDKVLGSLVNKENQEVVELWTAKELRRMMKEMFDDVYIDLSPGILRKLSGQIDTLEDEIRRSDVESVESEEIRSTLLPLLSLTLLHFYEDCREKYYTDDGHYNERARELLRKKDIKGPFTEASQESAETNYHEESATNLYEEQELPLDLDVVDQEILDVGQAIKILATKALKEATEWPGTVWSADTLDSLLRRLVRIHGRRLGHYSLPAIPIPRRGVGRILVESLRKQRLLIPVGRDEVRLVHESVLKYWPEASAWRVKEELLLQALQKLRPKIDSWEAAGRSLSSLQPLDSEVLDLAGRFLREWWDVFRPDDGTNPLPADQQLCDFSLAVLEAAMTPSAIAQGENPSTHFLTAVSYGRNDLLLRYLEKEPTAAELQRSASKAGAAYNAVFSNDLTTLELVLENKADPTVSNKDEWQAVHAAAHLGNIPMFDLLASRGADPLAPGANGQTPLHLAATNDQQAMVEHLLQVYKADPNVTNSDGVTPLRFACQSGSLQTIATLLSGSADPSIASNEGWSAFHFACRNRNAELVSLLMQQPQTDLVSTANGWSPLQLAIVNTAPVNESHEIVRVLLTDERVDRIAESPTKKSVVELAIDEAPVEVLKALLEDPYGKVDPNGSEGKTETPLLKACLSGKADFVRALVGAGADVNSAMFRMCERGNEEMVKLLLPIADYNKTDDAGRTALHLAVLSAHTEIVDLLVSRCDPEALDHAGANALHLAVDGGFVKPAEIIVRHCPALVEVPDGLGRMPIHIAAYRGHVQFLERRFNFKLDAKDPQGMTALHYAARFGNLGFSERLLETATIDPDKTDNYGWTPLHHAAQNGHLEIVKVLLKHGADKSLEGKDPELSPWLVAIAAGQTKLIEELMPKEKKRAERQALWEHAMFLAVKNAQFETALHLSNIEV